MSVQHQDSEYRRNARLIRSQVQRAREMGDLVICWRCGRPIGADQRYDIGHIVSGYGHGLENLAPEHRGENRRAGGKAGAEVQARAKARATRMLPW